MSLDLRRAVIGGIRASVAPAEIHVERPEEDPGDDHGWLRPPTTAAGAGIPRSKTGALILDLWADDQGTLEDMRSSLGWMDGWVVPRLGSVARAVYSEQSWLAEPRGGRWQGTLTWSVSYVDARVTHPPGVPDPVAMPP